MEIIEKRKCLECGEPLHGRADQKFCNDLCRNAFNNKKQGKTSKYIRKVNRILKNNHYILKELNVDKKTTVAKSKLDNQNFNFKYHTHVFTNRNGRNYYFCYDQGYLQLDDYRYLLVKKKTSEQYSNPLFNLNQYRIKLNLSFRHSKINFGIYFK